MIVSDKASRQQKGGELWQRGIQEMDEAVQLAPDHVGVRIPRGAVLLTASRYMPSPEMARPLIEKGVADFEKAYEVQAPHLADLGTHPRGELLMGLADGYSRLGDQEKAAAYFDEIITTLPGSAYAKRANTWKETKSLPVEQTTCVGCHVSKN